MIDRRIFIGTAAALAVLVQVLGTRYAVAEAYDVSGVAVDPALAERVPTKIREAGMFAIGSDNAYAPWEYLAGQDGQTPEGIDVDLANAIGAKLGVKAEFQTSSFDAIIPSLGSKYDLGISAFTITNERMKTVNFINYVESGALWAAKVGNPTGFDPADLCGRMLAIQTGTFFMDEINKEDEACKKAGKKPIEILPFSVQTEALTRVAAGGADATVGGDAMIGYAALQSRGTLETVKPAPGALGGTGLVGIAVVKSDEQLTQLIADTLNALMKDGTYKAILDHWGVGSLAVDSAAVNPSVKE